MKVVLESSRNLLLTEDIEKISVVKYQDPYYSNPRDLPPRPKIFAGLFILSLSSLNKGNEFNIPSCDLQTLKTFDSKLEGKENDEFYKEISYWKARFQLPSQSATYFLHLFPNRKEIS